MVTVLNHIPYFAPVLIMFYQHKQEQADEVKKKFAGDSRSDHIALLRAYQVKVYICGVTTTVTVHSGHKTN